VLAALGVRRGVVAVTKADLADPGPALEEAAALWRRGSSSSSPARRARAPASPRSRRALERVADATPRAPAAAARRPARRPRRSRSAAPAPSSPGRCGRGAIGAGDRLVVLPSGRRARVRAVQVHDADTPRARAGGRVAVNLVGWSGPRSPAATC
jgi:selenocysteine-specific elongation factor